MKIRLLGAPAIADAAGQAQSLKGQQAWALLARLLMTPRPLGRRVLAAELFPDTADPLGALRWSLAALRKAMGCPERLRGDPVETGLPDGTEVDVLQLDTEGFDVETAGGLLDGIDPQCSPEFATWLLLARERVASVIDARIRQQSQAAIAVGDHERAIRLAALGVGRRPFDESLHILLVKGLTTAGRFDAACQHVDATHAMFEAEIGESPSAALRSAARRTLSSPPSGVSPRAVVESLIESGRSALSAGAVDAGVDCLRRAATDAQACADARLQARTLVELGAALVHAVRGHDDEGAVLLRQSIEWSQRCGDAGLAATAYRELGYVDALAGRRPTAAAHLAQALELACDDDERASVHGVVGFNLVDWGRLDEGLANYEASLEHARRSGNRRRRAWSLGLGGWGLLAADRGDEADRWLTECLQIVDDLRWTAFRPWPCALHGESRLRRQADKADGQAVQTVQIDLEKAFALSCQLGDPCWEAVVARALGHACEALGDVEQALTWFSEARTRCTRETDSYMALRVEIFIDMARASAQLDQPAMADACAREALSLAARAHMDVHVERTMRMLGRASPV